MIVFVSLSVAAMIHSTRKNAIIAVMKSAKAIFQAPPWCSASWPPRRLMMMISGCWTSSMAARYRASEAMRSAQGCSWLRIVVSSASIETSTP